MRYNPHFLGLLLIALAAVSCTDRGSSPKEARNAPTVAPTPAPPQNAPSASSHPAVATSESEPILAAGVLNLVNAPVASVLDIYRELAGRQLVIAPAVEAARGAITLKTERPMTRTEVVKLLERAFQEQAGVLITPLDEQRVSVAYDPALAPRR